MKNPITSVKNFVRRHKSGLIFVSGVATALTLDTIMNKAARKQWNEFLEEKGLTEEFYRPEE